MAPSEMIAVVTGSSSGLGRAICERWRDTNRRCWGIDLRPGEYTDLVGDVQDDTFLKQAFECVAQLGHVDAVFLCAGVLGARFPDDLASAPEVLSVNVVGAYASFRTFLPLLASAPRGGAAVFISSISGSRGSPSHPIYAASKAGVEAMVGSLAPQAGRQGVRVVGLSPGSIFGTRFSAESTSVDLKLNLLATNSLPALLGPEGVAQVAITLAGPTFSGLTGTTVTLDCGESLARVVPQTGASDSTRT